MLNRNGFRYVIFFIPGINPIGSPFELESKVNYEMCLILPL